MLFKVNVATEFSMFMNIGMENFCFRTAAIEVA
jgi:hypothetical protein